MGKRGWTSCACVLLACGGGGNGATEDYTSAFPTPELFPRAVLGVSEVAPCEGERSGAGPQISFTRRRDRELYLLLDATPDQLGIDYRLADPFRVTSLSIAYDFDRTVDVPVTTLEEDCPTGVAFDDLRAGLPSDGVFAGVVRARDARDIAVRETRLSFASGERALTMTLPPGDAEEPDGALWVLFEPASGKGRVAIARATWGATIDVDGVPAGPGELALVSADLIFDQESGAVSARAGFGEAWRFRVSPWYGAGIDRATTGTVPLRRGRGPGERPAYFGPLRASEALSSERATLLASFSGQRETRLSAPCSAGAVSMTVLGFGELGAADQSASSGESLDVPILCEAGVETFEIPVSIRSLNQRLGALLITLVEATDA